MSENLKLAVQKSGRLYDGSMDLLKECGVRFHSGKNRLRVKATNFPLELYFLRNSDIPGYVENGIVDAGITGENVLVEAKASVENILSLGFSACRLSLAIPEQEEYQGLDFFQNKRIATSYPNTLLNHLSSQSIKAQVNTISGSVELAPSMNLADAVCDLVSSGDTLAANGLKEVEVLLHSQAVLTANTSLSDDKAAILNQLISRMQAVLRASAYKYVLLNAPDDKVKEVCEILPGLKSPTIIPLSDPGWSSVHTVIEEDRFWEIIDELKDAGAEGILVSSIEKLVY